VLHATPWFNQNSFTILVNAVNSKHIFSKIDTDSGDGHNESLWVNVYPMIARKVNQAHI
jgi:hypothetical protein